MNIVKLQTALMALAIVSCGGGGGDGVALAPAPGSGTPQPDSGIDRGGIAQGVITGFGSIFVNGIRFDTSSSTFIIDDNPGSESDLDVGKIVTVIGTINADGVNGTADSVTFDDEVEGPISSIDVSAGIFVVLGQTIRVVFDTLFDDSISPNSIEGLAIGQVVEISGFVGADGVISATHIELTNDSEFELTGIVTDLNVASMTFEINGQVIDYSAAQLEDFPAGQIENGMRVEAEGSMIGASGELIASKVEFEDDDLPGDEDDEIEIEGLITRYVSPTDFDVAGHPVTTNEATTFENGSAADLAVGIKVEVEGTLDSSNVLVAEKVSLRQEANIEIEAPVDATDSAAGTITVLGLVINTTEVTRFEDDSDMEVSAFGLTDISTGDWVEIKAALDSSGNIVAAQIERDDADDEVEVEATIDSVSRPDLVLLGLTIQSDSNTEFEDGNDMAINADEFFAQVSAGTVVKIKGTVLSGNVIAASEIEIEDPDD